MALPEMPPQLRELFPLYFWNWWQSFKSWVGTWSQADGSVKAISLADADAKNNSIYYSTTQTKLVYKDSAGVVHDLW